MRLECKVVGERGKNKVKNRQQEVKDGASNRESNVVEGIMIIG